MENNNRHEGKLQNLLRDKIFTEITKCSSKGLASIVKAELYAFSQ